MSGLSRMGQNCFGVGTPILSPLPPAGKTAATAGALHPASAPAPLSKEAEAAKSAPRKPRRRRPASAGPEPPGGHDSMAASGGAGPPRPWPLRLGSAPALGWGRSGEGGQGQSAHTDSAHPSRAGQAVVRPQGTIQLPVFPPGASSASVQSPAPRKGWLSRLAASPLAGPAVAAGGSVSPPYMPKGLLKP